MSDNTFKVTIERREKESLRCVLELEREENDTADKNESGEKTKELSAALRKLSDHWTSVAISFFETVPLLSDVGYFYADHKFDEETSTLLKEVSIDVEKSDDGDSQIETYRVPLRELPRVSKKMHAANQYLNTAATMKRSALAALVSEYEAFMGELLKIVSLQVPHAFLEKTIEITPEELSDFETLEELKTAKLEQILDDFAHGRSHNDLLKIVGEKFGVNLFSDKALIAEFTEVCQRRHLITHAGSKVNKRYLRVCKQAGCKEKDLPRLGEEVSITSKYLRRATARVFQVGFFTLHLLWQKILKETEGSDSAVLSSSHDFLEKDLTKMVLRVTKFAVERKGDRPHNLCHAYLVINQAQAYAFDPKLSKEEQLSGVEECLKQRDWSMMSPLTELALICLRKEYDEIEDKVVNAAKVGDSRLTYPDVFTWNIFREAREHSVFMDGVAKAFGSDEARKKIHKLPIPESKLQH